MPSITFDTKEYTGVIFKSTAAHRSLQHWRQERKADAVGRNLLDIFSSLNYLPFVVLLLLCYVITSLIMYLILIIKR